MDLLHAVLVGWGHHGSEWDLDIENLSFAGSERNSPNDCLALRGERLRFLFLVLGGHINGSIDRWRQVTELKRARFGLQDGPKPWLAISAARLPHAHQHVTSQFQALGRADLEPYDSPTGLRAVLADEDVPVVVEAVLFAAGCKAEWYVAKWMVRM